MKVSALVALLVAAAVLVVGCGGGSGSSGVINPGAPKKATAPNAPAGSKVISCKAGGGTARLRATAIDCGIARKTMQGWAHSHSCALPSGASRASCSLGSFRCQAVRVDRGATVSCARMDGDVSFIATAATLRRAGPAGAG
jgi:hypothetical protein